MKRKQRTKNLFLTNKDLLSSRELLDKIGWPGTFCKMSFKEIQDLRCLLDAQDAPSVRGITHIGYDAESHSIVLPNGLAIRKQNPEAAPVYVQMNNLPYLSQVADEYPPDELHLEAAGQVFRYLPKINRAPVAGALIGMMCTAPLASRIREMPGFKGYPFGVLTGEKGSGKSSVQQLLMSLCGLSGTAAPVGPPLTTFTTVATIAATNLIPVFIDEFGSGAFRGNEMSVFFSLLRQSYGGEIHQRGRPNQDVVGYPLRAPLYITGEERPCEPALLERMVCVRFQKEALNNEVHRIAFRRLCEAELWAFPFPFWKRTLTDDCWKKMLLDDRKYVRNWAKNRKLLFRLRVENNLSIMLLGIDLFNMYAEELDLPVSPFVGGTLTDILEAAVLEVMPRGRPLDNLEELLRFLASMAVSGDLVSGRHFGKTHDEMLVLPLAGAVAEARRYARSTASAERILNEDSYRSMVDNEAKKPGSFVKETSGRGWFFDRITFESKRARGVVIDPVVLEEQFGIDSDTWKCSYRINEEEEGQDDEST